MSDGEVLVTGGSGYLASHAIAQMLARGHAVRTTVRSLEREVEVRAMVAQAGVDPHGLQVLRADLMNEDGWAAAASGVEHVLHVASPFPAGAPRTEDDVIVPAREGTLRVLRAARAAGVKRVVLTSSFAAIGYGHNGSGPFGEDVWTNVYAPIGAYIKSKTLAERAAWDYVTGDGVGLELVVLNPSGIFGPVLGRDYAASVAIVAGLLAGQPRWLPDVGFGIVDVRDVAALHVVAMTHERAAGQRFIASAGFVNIRHMARTLRDQLGPSAARVPRHSIPTWLLKSVGTRVPSLAAWTADVGKRREPATGKATRVLGWRPRPVEQTIVDTARSLIALGERDR